MPPQNLSTPTQQQQHPEHHQMSQSLVEQHTVVSMTDQHSALEHAHSMAEHAAHSMLDLSETGSSLEHLAGGGHSSQSLVDLTTGRNPDQTIDSVSANGRRQNQMHDRIGLNEGGRDLGSLGGGNRPLSGLGGGSLSDRQNQPMRNMTPVGGDSRGVHGGGMGNSLSSDGHGSVGLAGNGNGLPDQGGFNPEQSQNLLDSMSSRGRPPSMGGGQHNLGTVDQQQHGAQQLPPHMRGLAEHQSHQHQSLVDHHSQQQNMDNNTNSHNGRGGMYGLDSGNGQLHSRPGSTLLSEGNNRNDARDLSRGVYNSSSGDRPQGHHSTSLIEETIAAVASNLNKSPDGGLMPGPLPPNSMMGHLGTLGLIRASSTGSHLGHGNDETLADLVGRHHPHGIPMLSERASQSLSGLMDDHSIGASSSGHGPGRELEKTHPCLTCLKMFRSKQQLAQHSLVHTGVRKHICSFCDRAFKQLSHLQQHVRIHTGERKYMCKFCERGFKQLSHLQKHTRIHTGQPKQIKHKIKLETIP
ncbi:adult enhancer factor 1 [Biomphalaria pfeifferi]|uniref:Adult enhancer factor 1 n=1 Tax=Biomphalaria pfeifferi TaxID=112525 RepID=A0AAD8BVM4_BIOPF|nr:adult enhancer factor 1 [Biomphalaria pfeifferi]